MSSLGDNHPPLAIPDLQTGSDYLSRLALANPVLAEQQLNLFLDALLAAPPDPGILLPLLEQARAPMSFVEEEMARHYHNKPLGLSDEEEARFQQVVAAWRKIGKGYALCASLEEPDPENANYLALMASLLHRCLYYTGMIILEHYRARRQLPYGIWLDLHGYYETAEEWGVAYTPVHDTLENSHQATHCAAAYNTLLLIDIAGPYSNSVRNLNLIRHWAGMWAPLITIHPLAPDHTVPSYIVELMKDAPLHPSTLTKGPGSDARRLDTIRLSQHIEQILAQLRQRVSPSELGLGEETSGHVIQLLDRLARAWTQAALPRKYRRFPAQGIARVAVGFEAMHFYVTNKEFEQPRSAAEFSRNDFDELFTFGDRIDPGKDLAIKAKHSYPIVDWVVMNHSANGFRLTCSNASQKIMHAQLMAVCPHDGEQFLLAQSTWLMQDEAGGLIVGLATLPGIPVGIGVRLVSTNVGANERYSRAFSLPPVVAVKEPGSLVLPSGMYQAGRTIELFSGDETWQVRMHHILLRGTDFDRVSYQPL